MFLSTKKSRRIGKNYLPFGQDRENTGKTQFNPTDGTYKEIGGYKNTAEITEYSIKNNSLKAGAALEAPPSPSPETAGLMIDENTTSDQLMALLNAFLRPATDAAIKSRERAGAYNNAETDADAASRGMLGSTYVTSMKEREFSDMQDDIGDIEAQYSAALASYLYDAMFQIAEMKNDREEFDREMDYKYDVLRERENGSGRGSSGRGAGRGKTRQEKETEDFLEYIDGLSDADIRLLYYDTSKYWRERRKMISDVMGEDAFNAVMEDYMRKISDVGHAGTSSRVTRVHGTEMIDECN
ncbi:MAG: hypothetical protein RR352_04445 [Clostridia bacterium]